MVITGIVLKRKLLRAFSVIIVQVRIFTGLDRNEFKEVIKNFRDTCLYEYLSLIFSHLVVIKNFRDTALYEC